MSFRRLLYSIDLDISVEIHPIYTCTQLLVEKHKLISFKSHKQECKYFINNSVHHDELI